MLHGVHGEEKRDEGDRDDQEERRGSQKERETNLASDQFHKCSPQPETPRDSQG